ncbi:MAG: haloacid dehalogenase [Chloroflexota bacterium]|nr:MAG: haloacid dehalogenase [Chloroflexota bacterium]HDD62671.1 HAD-IIA family hydrolase [Chloroflexota bacterium]
MKLKKYKAILFDGDGVLWKSDHPLNGIIPLFDFLAKKEIHWALLTNNNSHTIQHYLDKFAGMGIQIQPGSVFTSATVTAAYLLDQYGPGASLHVVGSKGLIYTLDQAGFSLSHGEDEPQGTIAAVVAGMDLEINYQKIKIAMRLILNGAAFIATNTDGSYPTSEGINPATGMVIGALQVSSGVTPYVVGKPHKAIFEAALDELGVKPEEALMVGDRLDTDILGANQYGVHSAAVLTGISSRETIEESTIKPSFVFENITTLLQALAKVYE